MVSISCTVGVHMVCRWCTSGGDSQEQAWCSAPSGLLRSAIPCFSPLCRGDVKALKPVSCLLVPGAIYSASRMESGPVKQGGRREVRSPKVEGRSSRGLRQEEDAVKALRGGANGVRGRGSGGRGGDVGPQIGRAHV